MAKQTYVNNTPDVQNAQLNDAPVNATNTQLARIALKKIANYKSTALEFPLAHFLGKIHQEDITRTDIDRYKVSTHSTLSLSIINISTKIDNVTIVDIGTMEQDMAYGINVVQHKYSNEQNFKGNHYS